MRTLGRALGVLMLAGLFAGLTTAVSWTGDSFDWGMGLLTMACALAVAGFAIVAVYLVTS